MGKVSQTLKTVRSSGDAEGRTPASSVAGAREDWETKWVRSNSVWGLLDLQRRLGELGELHRVEARRPADEPRVRGDESGG